jgi:glucosamine-6-phosphate deaminase
MEDAIRTLAAGSLRVAVFRDRGALGRAAARAASARMRELLARREGLSAVFAAAASQVEFLERLAGEPGIDWKRVTAFHLDEYVGVPSGDGRSFGRFLRERLFDCVRPAAFHALDGMAGDPEAECLRYEALLQAHPLDLAFIGIGENGHLAFNDPHVADFADPRRVKVVVPDARSRAQQVADGAFREAVEMPARAYTLTMPAILSAGAIFCMVPGERKAEAVRRALEDPVAPACPATALRTHREAYLYLDADSSRGIDTAIAR